MDVVIKMLRSEGKIVLTVRTSALAASLHEHGHTAHNLFDIPVTNVRVFSLHGSAHTDLHHKNTADLCSRIHPNTYCAELIDNASAIIWEELPSANITVIQCANCICQQIKCSACPFGGILFISLGDFQQIAPIHPH